MKANIKTGAIIVPLILLLSACDESSKAESEGGGNTTVAEEAVDQPRDMITLNAFSDFDCTSAWTMRDGALGLRAGSGAGVCNTIFGGKTGEYRITLIAQTEFDGAPSYSIQVNRVTVKSGNYPYSKGQLICDCPNWRRNCPDKQVDIPTPPLTLNQGDVITFSAQEVYPCGPSHGAYAKWLGMKIIPVE